MSKTKKPNKNQNNGQLKAEFATTTKETPKEDRLIIYYVRKQKKRGIQSFCQPGYMRPKRNPTAFTMMPFLRV